MKLLSKFIFFFLFFTERCLQIFTKRSFFIYLTEFIQDKTYKKINIQNKKITFFAPNYLIKWRVDTIFSKEPETIEWINNFKNNNNEIFWDIGANIGLYSIYNSIKNKKISTIAFEPSTSNLRVLSRNISVNKLQKKIKIFTLPLSDKQNGFMTMKENVFREGGSMNSFGANFDHEGKKYKSNMNYSLFGTNIFYLIKNKILKIPQYIKIDVDGIEHLILKGAGRYLREKKLKSISVEINENFSKQLDQILKLMRDNNFKIRHKKHNIDLYNQSGIKFVNTYNYIFDKK